MNVSRRQFLQWMGGAVAAAGAAALPHANAVRGSAATPLIAERARALCSAPLRLSPSPESPVVRYLWEDETFAVRKIWGHWLRTDGGFVSAHDAQPMTPQTPQPIDKLPQWGEVIAPSAPVRAWCAADAPLVAKLGHGAVMRLIDQIAMPDAVPFVWFGVARDDGELLGWSPGPLWSEAVWETAPPFDLIVRRDVRALLVVQDGIERLLSTVGIAQTLANGVYRITARTPSATRRVGGKLRLGVPWVQQSGNDLVLGGVYWHNSFDRITAGLDIQMPPLIARTVFGGAQRIVID